MKNKMIKALLALFLLGFTGTGLVLAQEEISGDQSGFVSFDFKDADIRNVLRIFSHKTGMNIVASPEVLGSVTVKLNEVAWEKALRTILEMHGFAYVREENVIKVMSQEKVQSEPLKTEIFTMDYAKVNDIKPTITNILTERGKVESDDRSNILIVTDVPSNFETIAKVLERLDTPPPQVLIESKIIETTLDMTRNFGVRWSFLDGYTVGTSAFSVARVNSKTRTSNNTLGENYTYNPLIEHPDANPRNTFIGTYSSDPITGDPVFDIEDVQATMTRDEWPNYNHNLWGLESAALTKSETLSNALTKTRSWSTVLSASAFELVMSAFIGDGGTDILSAPSVVTMNGTQASVEVAVKRPIPKFTYNEDIGGYEISSFEEKPIGITMKVLPNVSPNGYVTMDLEPKVSNLQGEQPFGALGFSYPITSEEAVKTRAMVKDGDTIVIGGLIRQEDSFDGQKVPLLHSIPVLGWLFKAHEKTVAKRNLLIFVTPTIINKENIPVITQDKADGYTKYRSAQEEPTELYPNLGPQ